MVKFEVVKKYADANLNLPERATVNSAGYDLEAADDIIIPSLYNQIQLLCEAGQITSGIFDLSEVANFIKDLNMRPTLVSTGLKCKLERNMYLQLVSRSSMPLKTLLLVANSVGIIDADYYNNESNEGEIFVQFINLSPYDIQIHKGDKIAQAIISRYDIVAADNATGLRSGGFGSTTK